MANSKSKTLWTLSGRVVDSREVLDNNGGLLAGRVDIPESLMVFVEGYSKVEYRTTHSDGSVTAVATFSDWVESVGGVIETKGGSGYMTVFFPKGDKVTKGVFQLDVYKEWEDADPEPENPSDSFVGVHKFDGAYFYGFRMTRADGDSYQDIRFTGGDVNKVLPDSQVIKDLSARLTALENPAK